MAASVLPIRVYNPRGPRDLSYPFDDRESTAGSSYAKILDDLDDRLRVNFANLEGDFPKPSSLAPDKGVIQYFYHDDAQDTFRDDRRDKFRGPYKNLKPDIPGKYRGKQSSYISKTEFTVPANNTWRMTIELDDARRDMQNLEELGIMSIESISKPGWDITEYDDGFTNWSLPIIVIDILPMKVEFTTSARWAAKSNENLREVDVNGETKKYKNTIYVPPGATVTVRYKIQESPQLPNEDFNYLSVEANDASWELGKPVSVSALEEGGFNIVDVVNSDGSAATTWKPHEDPPTQPAKIRVVSTNYDTNEDAFYYDDYGPDGFIKNAEDTHIVDDARTSTRSSIGFWDQIAETVTKLLADTVVLGKSETDTEQSGIHNRAMRTVTNANAFPYVAGEDAINTWQDGQPLVRHFWSAAAVSYVLTTAEMRALRTQSALDYAMYGYEVDWRNWKNVRKYDIAVFKFKNASGGHVGFITDVDLSTNKVKIAGGNQSNKFKETEYRIDSVDMYLLTVRRNWVAAGTATVV